MAEEKEEGHLTDDEVKSRRSRREFLKFGVAAGAAGVGAIALAANSGLRAGISEHEKGAEDPHSMMAHAQPSGFLVLGDQMDPMEYLTKFDYGIVSTLPDGRTLREYEVVALDRTIQVAPGVFYPAWTYNGQVPGPTLRATEGDLLRIYFKNRGSHPHTIHFHGFHAANMDGVLEIIEPGGTYTYEFVAEPFGLHLYHCHTPPLKKHIEKGLYGVFVVDPKTPRSPAKELVMMMNGFDVNFDGENEFYTVNGIANYYLANPIKIKQNELVRVYVVNITEFDLINSIHTHATFFKLYRTGTQLDKYEFTDTVILGQGERAILEFTYKFPGKFMFHAHQSEFAELGWMGFFQVEQ
jgi:FtsP/CotA-like multicopper oxidase with cupredoxin domain